MTPEQMQAEMERLKTMGTFGPQQLPQMPQMPGANYQPGAVNNIQSAVNQSMMPAATIPQAMQPMQPLQMPQAPQAPQAPQEKPGLLSRIGSGVQDFVQDKDRMMDLAAAFNSMRYAPDAGIQQAYADRQKMRTVSAQANQTVAQLRKLEQQGDAAAGKTADLIEAYPEQAKAIYSAYVSQQYASPKSTFSQMSGKQLSEAGIPGFDPEKSYNVDNVSGKITQIGSGDFNFNMPTLTESQGGATNFYNRALGANDIINATEAQGTELGQFALGQIPLLGNMLITPGYRRFSSAKNDFISAVLRKESGAAISVAEFEKEDVKYFPQPGDDAQVIADKKASRERALQGLKFQSGKGANLVESARAGVPPNVSVTKVK